MGRGLGDWLAQLSRLPHLHTLSIADDGGWARLMVGKKWRPSRQRHMQQRKGARSMGELREKLAPGGKYAAAGWRLEGKRLGRGPSAAPQRGDAARSPLAPTQAARPGAGGSGKPGLLKRLASKLSKS